MREMFCLQESAVAHAARTGEWSSSLTIHAAACAICKEVVEAVRAMERLAIPTPQDAATPTASLLWCQALLGQKQAEAERALRPLRLAEWVPAAVMALASAAFFVWYWPQVLEQTQAQFIAWQTGLWPQLWQAGWSLVGMTLELSSAAAPFSLVLMALVAALVAHPLLAEE